MRKITTQRTRTTFNIRVRHSDRATVLHCKGRIVRGQSLELLRQELLSEQHRWLVTIDLAEVDAVDAAGLGLLASVGARIHLQLVNCSRRVAEVLKLTGLHRVMEVSLAEPTATIKGSPACPVAESHGATDQGESGTASYGRALTGSSAELMASQAQEAYAIGGVRR